MKAIYFMTTYVSVGCLEESHHFLPFFPPRTILSTPVWNICKFNNHNSATWKETSKKWLLLFWGDIFPQCLIYVCTTQRTDYINLLENCNKFASGTDLLCQDKLSVNFYSWIINLWEVFIMKCWHYLNCISVHDLATILLKNR